MKFSSFSDFFSYFWNWYFGGGGVTNDPPKDIVLSSNLISENVTNGIIGQITVNDTDDNNHTYSISDDRFEIDGEGQLRLKKDAFLDYEQDSHIDIQITATDSEGGSVTRQFTIEVGNVNEAPTDMTLSEESIIVDASGVPNNQVVGQVSTIDPDKQDAHTYEVNDIRFEVNEAGELVVKEGVVLDVTLEPSIDIEIIATDEGGLSVTKIFTLTLSDAPLEALEMQLDSTLVSEHAEGEAVGQISINGKNDVAGYQFTLNDARFMIDDKGLLRLKENESLDFEQESLVDIAVTVSDTYGRSLTQDYSIQVANIGLDAALMAGIDSNAQFNSDITTIRYSFYEASGQNYGIPSQEIQNNFRTIFANTEALINLKFLETDNVSQSEIRISYSDEVDYAAAYYPYNGDGTGIAADILLNPNFSNSNDTNGFENEAGYHGFMALVHEFGHAMGLKHPHDDSPNLPENYDNTANTVMTYNFTGNAAGSFMSLDVATLQALYGKGEGNSEDTIYTFKDTYDYQVNGEDVLTGDYAPTKMNIWDASGLDTLDFSLLKEADSGYLLDMNPGGWIVRQDNILEEYFEAGTTLSFDMMIENVINSGSNDKIILNAAKNTISGYGREVISGHDVISNHEDSDLLDLSMFYQDEIEFTQVDNNLLINLNAGSSITVSDYYVNNNHLGIALQDGVVESMLA